MSKVSVIIPNYNHAKYLKQRIDSVLNQTYQDFDVIILDDSSTDESKTIIEQYRDHPKVKIYYNQQNSGSVFKQWKKGIDFATGKYIWIAESDDYCEKTFLEELISKLEANNKCVIAYAQSYVINDNNEIFWHSSHKKLFEYVNGITFIKNYMLYGVSIFNASMAIFKKEVFYEISDRYTTFKACGDWLFWIELAQKGDVCISAKLLNYFRKNTASVSNTSYQSGYNYIEELNLLNFLKEDKIINEKEFKDVLLSKFLRYYSSKKQISTNHKKLIDDLFYQNKSYSFYLHKNALLNLIKKQLKFYLKKLK